MRYLLDPNICINLIQRRYLGAARAPLFASRQGQGYRWKKRYAGPAVGSGTGTPAAAGRECTTQDAGGRAAPRQSHFARRRHKKVGRPALKREVVRYITSHYSLKLRRACALIRKTRSAQYYLSVKDPKKAKAAQT